MKKHVMGLMILLSSLPMIFGGCSITPEQAQVIADQAGMYGAVGWIALDNPSPEAIAAVGKVMVTAETGIKDVKAGKTYTEVVYPQLVIVINKDVPEQYRPLAKAGSLSVLGGLDLLFVMHPEWKADETLALNIATAYVKGVERGLNLNPQDPIMLQARQTATMRVAAMRGAPDQVIEKMGNRPHRQHRKK